MHFIVEHLRARLQLLPAVKRYIIGFSGGLDSTALLHAILQLELKAEISAVHINHQLNSESDQWAAHCRSVCSGYAVPLHVQTVNISAAKRDSPEAAARDARYAALKALIKPRDCLLTAQHQDDQAETVILQLLRGSGLPGLAAMPDCAVFGQGYHARPLLDITRNALSEYAQMENLVWVEDGSNTDHSFDRNYVRHMLSPVLRARWPSFTATLSRSARHQAEANSLLEELAEQDLGLVRGSYEGCLSVSALRSLSTARCRNVIRYYIKCQQWLMPAEMVLKQIIAMLDLPWDKSPEVNWGQQIVRRYRNELFFFERLPVLQDKSFVWHTNKDLHIPELGLRLSIDELIADGLHVDSRNNVFEVRFRQGGESIRLPGRRHSHKLKNLLQETGVPPWLRARLPLLYQQGRLVAVAGIKPIIVADPSQTP